MLHKRTKWIIGIDEAGRGPLAGPVVVAGIKINSKCKIQNAKLLKNIRDSKKLTPKQREEWFRILTTHPKIEWAVAKVSPKIIDRINIARSTNLGAARV
ncbi:MAG: ribonuclease HII, partial [Patescibacteria group bacterium]